MNEKELFLAVFENFKNRYSGLELKHFPYGDIVYYNGVERFNIEGYNLLYNLTRLCEVLKKELI